MTWARPLSNSILILSFLVASFANAETAARKATQAPAGYNELHDERGQVRPQYRELHQMWSRLSPQQREQYLVTSRQAFSGDNALDSLPRILTGAEYDQVVKPGVEQRAKALRAFLQDHYSGQRSYLRANLVPADVLERIIGRNYELGYDKLVKPDHIAFLYGPDIIRDARGTFRVIEDNPGFIGGLGDLRLAYQETLKLYAKNPQIAPYRSPEEFYKDLATKYKAEAALKGGKAVVYMTPPYADKEDFRIQKIFRDYGIETVTNKTNRRLKVQNDGVYIENVRDASQPLEKVGFVAMIGEHWWLDPSHRESKLKQAVIELESHLEDPKLNPKVAAQMTEMLERLQTKPDSVRMVDVHNLLDRSDYSNSLRSAVAQSPGGHGLIKAILERRVGSNYAPGLDFIGDKEFYTFVEDMIRYYLREEPILKNITTERFADPRSGGLNEVLFQKIFSNLSKYVVKKVDGRGGDSVWVGPKMTAAELPALRQRIQRDPGMYIVQEYMPLSYMNDVIVDMRVISDVSPGKILVTETPWGRGLPMSGNGKVNLSDQGREITILVGAERAPFCKSMFKK
ncbi:MAG: circularly permuted type 2 ATP-grasp protein [Bdellovibrio sp.]|jgi:uncharacterized circularly permuted ATP-grasp superfamily protein